MMGKRAGWIGGAVFLVLVILAGTWFLVASPRFDAAAQTQQMAEEARARNDLLELQVARLRADYALLDEYRAEIAEIQVQIPPEAELDRILAEVHDLAEDTDAFIVDISPGLPEIVTFAQPAPVAPEPAPVEPTEGEEPEQVDDGEATAEEPSEPEPTGPVPIDGFIAVPFQITVLGEFDAVAAFLDGMQTGMDRLYLVTDLGGVRQQESEASGGKPEIEDGHVELTINGYAYVLANETLLRALVVDDGTDDGEDVEEEQGELPSSDDNPFEPLAPTRGGGGGDD